MRGVRVEGAARGAALDPSLCTAVELAFLGWVKQSRGGKGTVRGSGIPSCGNTSWDAGAAFSRGEVMRSRDSRGGRSRDSRGGRNGASFSLPASGIRCGRLGLPEASALLMTSRGLVKSRDDEEELEWSDLGGRTG